MSKTSIACIALNGGKVLIAHRNPVGQMGGRWEFPGGKVEEGESHVETVQREFKEEFGVDVNVGELIASSEFEHNLQTVNLYAYRIYVPHDGMKKKFILTEHSEYAWVSFEEIKDLNFVDSDLKIYPMVRDYAMRQGVE